MKSTSTTGPAPSGPPNKRGAAQLLLIAGAAVFTVGAILHNPWLVALAVRAARAIVGRDGIAIPDSSRIFHAALIYLIAAVACGVAAWLVGRVGPLDRFLRRPLIEKVLLAVTVFALPLAWLEIGLRPFVPDQDKSTSLFVRDDDLGWRLRPGATQSWGGVDVTINPRGFRGPVIPYLRTNGATRVLYLGDSVTFGYRVDRWQDTYPFLLGDMLAAREARTVETINLSVEGYSQWQQHGVLTRDGFNYAPDLVVLGFVLNDVTEMFYLPQFGGTDEGFQLRHTYASSLDRLLSKSALVYEIRNVIVELKAKRRLGEDPRLGAIKQEQLDVETIMREPDQPNVAMAWDYALSDLQRIADDCAANDTPLLVVVFPFAVQLGDPEELGAPQQVIATYAREQGIACFDLLPALADSVAGGRAASDFFVDHDHLSEEGHRVVATLLADTVAAMLSRRPN
jgi:lysophospholipase L1-like esterase